MKGFDAKFRDFPDYIVGITKEIWEDRGIATLHQYYAEDIVVRSPASVVTGNQGVIAATMALRSISTRMPRSDRKARICRISGAFAFDGVRADHFRTDLRRACKNGRNFRSDRADESRRGQTE